MTEKKVKQQKSDWIDTNTAMRLIQEYDISCTRTSLLTWIRKYHLGKKVGGRWYVDKRQLDKFLKGDI